MNVLGFGNDSLRLGAIPCVLRLVLRIDNEGNLLGSGEGEWHEGIVLGVPPTAGPQGPGF